jgi:hypothetical protein
LAHFPDFEPADAERRRLEAEARTRINPFHCGLYLSDWTSFDGGRLHDWLLDIGLTPPSNKTREGWLQWWQQSHEQMSELQTEQLWQALDRLRFYEVIESPIKNIAFVVVRINWRYNDEEFFASAEGGAPFRVYRNRLEAETLCAQSKGQLSVDDSLDMSERLRLRLDPLGFESHSPEAGRFEHYADAPMYEVLEVEVEA